MNWMLDAGFYNMDCMGELEDMEEAMQANTGAKDEAVIYIRGEDITEALDDIIIRRKSC